MLLTLSLVFAKDKIRNTQEQSLSSWQKQFYQSNWQQRVRFTDKPDSMRRRIMSTEKKRIVYPCYCYKPQSENGATTASYEKYMIETKDIFFLNK
ncbi:uncharacterized protein LOC117783840 [Drosophila innubila]|uniref:uncharacterized protein LOC117783840 n=1 Tax=Drosophila innubila TaxID=198719 RepID=UPI00148CCFAA|nr:uncharacterized protein LOC117783840 [Drosophila innubila]